MSSSIAGKLYPAQADLAKAGAPKARTDEAERQAARDLAESFYPSTVVQKAKGGAKTEPTTVAIPAAASSHLGQTGDPWAKGVLERLGVTVIDAEPPAASVTDYNAVTGSLGKRMKGAEAEYELVKKVALRMGMGITRVGALAALTENWAKHGPHKLTDDQAMKILQKRYGDKLEAKLAAARAMLEECCQDWADMKRFLEASRLGSHPKFIRLLIEQAEKRSGKR